MRFTPGMLVNGYRVDAEIGRGGMAVVYRAHQASLGRDVALKVLPAAYVEDAELRARFQQEARAVARLRHPAILVIHDVGAYHDAPYLVTELVEGGTLAGLLGTPQPLDKVLRLLRPIAEALDYAHGLGILHRDVKPGNILLRRDGSPVLADFGLARPTDGGHGLTRTGMTMGTPAYMAPEQAMQSAESLTGAVDQYALAVIAYELLTGRPPFSGPTPLAVALAQMHQLPPPPRTLNPEIPPAVEEVLLRGLAKAPEARYPSALAFVEALAAGARTAQAPHTIAVNGAVAQAALAGADAAPTPILAQPATPPLATGAGTPPGGTAGQPTAQPLPADQGGARRPVLLIQAAGLGLIVLLALLAVAVWHQSTRSATGGPPRGTATAQRPPTRTPSTESPAGKIADTGLGASGAHATPSGTLPSATFIAPTTTAAPPSATPQPPSPTTASLPLVAPSPTAPPPATATVAPTSTPLPPTATLPPQATYTPLPTYTPYPTDTPVPSDTPVPPTATSPPLAPTAPRGQGAVVVTMRFGAALHDAPASDAPVVWMLSCGDSATVLGKSGGWYAVRFTPSGAAPVEGWVGGARVADAANPPPYDCAGAVTFQIHEQVSTQVPTGCLSLRQTPSRQAPYANCVQNGFQYEILSGPVSVNGEDWFQVTSPSTGSGWVLAQYLVPSS